MTSFMTYICQFELVLGQRGTTRISDACHCADCRRAAPGDVAGNNGSQEKYNESAIRFLEYNYYKKYFFVIVGMCIHHSQADMSVNKYGNYREAAEHCKSG